MKKLTPNQTINSYITNFPTSTQKLLQEIRQTIAQAAPTATEAISYGIPTFKLNGNLVHFAGYEHHIGFYPGAAAMVEFAKDFSKYKTSKGTVQFPIDQPIPHALIKKIVKARVKIQLEKKLNRLSSRQS